MALMVFLLTYNQVPMALMVFLLTYNRREDGATCRRRRLMPYGTEMKCKVQ